MKTRLWMAVGALALFATAWGCGGSDTSTSDGNGTGGAATGGTGGGDTGGTGGATGGTGGSATGGTGGSATGGTGGGDTGGTGGATGGTGGGDTGGAGGSSTGGTGGGTGGAGGTATGGTGGGASFWTDAYDPAGTPSPSSGKHKAGDNCLNCHTGGSAPAWLFGGTIFLAGGGGAAHVQVGVKDANGFYTAYSATNGNFWYPKGSATVDWASAEIRARNANGEIIMNGGAGAGCNSCHTGNAQLIAP